MTAPYPSIPGVAFKMVPGFPAYCVGDDGSVWSRLKQSGRGNLRGSVYRLSDEWRQLKLMTGGRYRTVNLYRDGKMSVRTVHSLVLESFVGPRSSRQQGCHFPDRDTSNNRLDNLRWDDDKANKADMLLHGTRRRGVTVYLAKLDDDKVREIRKLSAEGVRNTQIALRFNVTPAAIGYILRGKTWTHVT